jgi:hypothetical protein
MRVIALSCFAILSWSCSLRGQTVTPAPQSARQALIEMFTGKSENDFIRHLPDEARQTLVHKGESPETSFLLRIPGMCRGLADGGKLETFESGPNILTTDQGDGRERIEVAVEHDSVLGEEEEIELSVHSYKDGEPELLPVVPRLIFTLKEEKDIWRLTEVTLAAHVPLTDPDYLKGLRKQQNESNESAARFRMAVIALAENRYAAAHPDTGYSCTLLSLFPSEDRAEEGANFIESEDSNGYHFALAGCEGKPALKYGLTAVPVDTKIGMKAFCVDESGTLRSVAADKHSNCFSRGQVVSEGVGQARQTD